MVIKHKVSWDIDIYYTENGSLEDIKKVKIGDKVFEVRKCYNGSCDDFVIKILTELPGFVYGALLSEIVHRYEVILLDGAYEKS